MTIARAYGLPVPDCEIIELADTKALVVKRFDRRLSQDGNWIMRIPQEDYCQVFNIPPGKKYEADGGPGIKAIMQHLLGSDNAEEDQLNFMKSQVLFWLLAATDGHAKNFSLFIKPEGRYQLTPFYDILSAYPIIGPQGLYYGKIKLSMALKGTTKKKYKPDKIYPRHFMQTAKDVGFDPDLMRAILYTFKAETPGVITRVKKQLPTGFPKKISQAILNGLSQCAQRLENMNI